MSDQTRSTTPAESTLTVIESEENVQQVMNDEQVKHRKLVQEMEHPSGKNIKLIGPPVKYSVSKNKHRYPPPLLGQHTTTVLMDVLGYPQDKIRNLKENGIVQ